MKVENPVALRFILQDELYLLNTDKNLYAGRVATLPEEVKTPGPITTTTPKPLPLPQHEPIVPQVLQPEVRTPEPAFNYLGKNLKNFLVLVYYPDAEFIEDAHLTALSNIIKRKDLSIDDIAILNLASHITANLDELKQFFKPAKMLLLGNPAIPQGMPALTLNVIKPADDFAALYSFSFGEMMDNTDKKKAFWEQMKSL